MQSNILNTFMVIFFVSVMSACGDSSNSGSSSSQKTLHESDGSGVSVDSEITNDVALDANPFSMIIASDPQMFRSFNPNKGEHGLEDPTDSVHSCGAIFIDRVELCASVAANEAVVNSISKISDLSTWPQAWDCDAPGNSIQEGCLSKGLGLPITRPVAVIINGDLTENYEDREANFYGKLYDPSNFSQQLYIGLGNHDYQNSNTDQERNAVEWMLDEISALPPLASHDMEGAIYVEDGLAFRKVRFRVNTNGNRSAWKIVSEGVNEWSKQKVRRDGHQVSVQIQEKLDNRFGSWETIDTINLADPVGNVCLRVRAANWVQQISCPNYVVENSVRAGSMSYSFNRGNYHFVQLHFHLGYERDLTNVPGFPGFNIKSAEAWLTKDLTDATRNGRIIIINVHSNELTADLKDFLTSNNNWNVAAVFSGHTHEDIGKLGKEWKVTNSEGVERVIPNFRSGAALCGTMLYVDFHDDYFNWASVRAWTPGSGGATKHRPGTVGVLGQDFSVLQYAVGEPMFIKESSWDCHYDDGPRKLTKRGTVVFNFPEPTDPPIASCVDVTVSAGENCSADANIDAGSYDPDGGPVTLSQDPSGPYGPGDTQVTLTVVDESATTSSCTANITVTDNNEPVISCNIPDASPPDAPLSITASAMDNCSVSDISISKPDCYKINEDGKRIDLNQSCNWELSSDTLTLRNTGGVGTQYDWQVTAIDESGNEASTTCHLDIQNPGLTN